MKNPPCKDCEERFVGCHSQCEKYKEWRSARDEINGIVRKAKTEERMIIEHFVDTCGAIDRHIRRKTLKDQKWR